MVRFLLVLAFVLASLVPGPALADGPDTVCALVEQSSGASAARYCRETYASALIPIVVEDNTVEYHDKTHGGRSATFHLDAGDYQLVWSSSTELPHTNKYNGYCGITLHVVTANGYSAQQVVANEEIYIYQTGRVHLQGLPAGRYDYNVFGCDTYSIDLSPE